jgi:uncharacterized protein YgiM (DUF1202 family)
MSRSVVQGLFGLKLLCAVLLFASFSRVALAIDYRSIGGAPSVLYDAPSEKGRRVSIAPRGMPVEVVLAYGNWTKVRDASGELSWVQTRDLASTRTVVTTTNLAKVRSNPSDSASVVFNVSKGVVLQLVQPAESGWLRIRHQDGQEGFIRLSDIWGG